MTSVLLSNQSDSTQQKSISADQTSSNQAEEISYPSEDGEPVAETYDPLYAMLTTLEVLKQFLVGEEATVLANQFLYYSKGFPSLRVAPDVMVIFKVEPGGRDNYKIWEEGEVPSVIFEFTSNGTQDRDKVFKKTLYAQLGVQEYWMFDPRGEWIKSKLEGYRLNGEEYKKIDDQCSEPLGLRLEVEETIIGFYRQDTGEKLLVPDEMRLALQEAIQARVEAQTQFEQEKQRADSAQKALESERQKAAQLAEKLRELGIDPDTV
ncbi:MAG: Uma2 family endonuclease [Cyanobacteria bacterium P01_F01_bin.150]